MNSIGEARGLVQTTPRECSIYKLITTPEALYHIELPDVPNRLSVCSFLFLSSVYRRQHLISIGTENRTGFRQNKKAGAHNGSCSKKCNFALLDVRQIQFDRFFAGSFARSLRKSRFFDDGFTKETAFFSLLRLISQAEVLFSVLSAKSERN